MNSSIFVASLVRKTGIPIIFLFSLYSTNMKYDTFTPEYPPYISVGKLSLSLIFPFPFP